MFFGWLITIITFVVSLGLLFITVVCMWKYCKRSAGQSGAGFVIVGALSLVPALVLGCVGIGMLVLTLINSSFQNSSNNRQLTQNPSPQRFPDIDHQQHFEEIAEMIEESSKAPEINWPAVEDLVENPQATFEERLNDQKPFELDSGSRNESEMEDDSAENTSNNEGEDFFSSGSSSTPSSDGSGFNSGNGEPPIPLDAKPRLAEELGKCPEPLPALSYQLRRAEMSELEGQRSGAKFEISGPPNSVLVGLEVETEEPFDHVRSIRPIFLVGSDYHYGTLIGTRDDGKLTRLLAEPGYAVGGINVGGGFGPSSVQLVYMLFDETGKLDRQDQYLSDTVGRKLGRTESLHANGWHIVGLFGHHGDKVNSIGLAAINARPDKTKQAAQKVDTSQPRIWTSEDGQFTVLAVLVKVEEGNAHLKRESDGVTIQVPIEKFGAEDRAVLEQQ